MVMRLAERLEQGSVDWITLTSSAIAERLFALMSGSVTTLVQLGFTVGVGLLLDTSGSMADDLGDAGFAVCVDGGRTAAARWGVP